MDYKGRGCSSSSNSSSISTISEEDIMELRRGPWTVDEDFKLINYISNHGEGRWNSLARCSGLKRSGKSCRLRWLNYLRPDVRRGNISLEEQLLILDLHSRWGNRWSKIAQHLPGRTDNEIKNYWRTRVQKHAKQLQCDVNSKQFKDTMRYVWIPRLIERIQANKANTTPSVDVGMMQQALQVTPPGASSGLADHNANPNPHYFHTQAGFRESSISPMGPGFDFQQALEANIPLMDGGDASDNLCNINVDDLWWSLQQQFNTIV